MTGLIKRSNGWQDKVEKTVWRGFGTWVVSNPNNRFNANSRRVWKDRDKPGKWRYLCSEEAQEIELPSGDMTYFYVFDGKRFQVGWTETKCCGDD